MKRFLLSLLSLTLMFSAVSVSAKSGDTVGKIYATDIKACINGVWVDSYNIGGKTVVVVEDITSRYKYSDALRTLIIDDLNPDYLVSGKNNLNNKKIGTIIGNVYDTDIKTYFRGKQLTSYSLNGKMAVVIEELGAYSDVNFSEIGGRYTWDAKNRTISLESVYSYPYTLRYILSEKRLNMRIKDERGLLWADFVNNYNNYGHIVHEVGKSDNSMYVVLYNDGVNETEIIGYLCSFEEMKFENDRIVTKQADVDYFYMEKLSDILSGFEPAPMTYEDRMNHYEYQGYGIIDEFETDEYHFLYMGLGLPHGGTQCLKKVNKKDGTVVDYSDQFESVSSGGGKRFENVSIDKENEKVYLHYDADYVIDLKTDEVNVYTVHATDIGDVKSDEKPSEYNEQCAKNSQKKYKLTCEDGELIVNGFFCHEYFYATMLPLKETFDFLNIKYSFENDVLTIDTSDIKKEFAFEMSDENIDFMNGEPIEYMYVDKVILNGEETDITYRYTSGHFEQMRTERKKAKPYIVNGKVYINDSFISLLVNEENKK